MQYEKMPRILVLAFILYSYLAIAGDPPFGGFDTPSNGATVSGEISLTGWALDDQGIISLKLYYSADDGQSQVYIDDAIFVQGARPDIEAAYPDYPNNDSAGWGYSLMTYFLPNGGNGTFILYAKATDLEGNTVTLGAKTIHADNDNAVKPFGNLDTPIQGSTVTGTNFSVQGWVLTPPPNTIPTDGSTITIYIDGSPVGHPTYNIYRNDIATMFPGYNNSNGAMFYLQLNTTDYSDGLHSIHVMATDDAGNTDGFGSRYFTIENDQPLPVFIDTFSGYPGPKGITLNWTTVSESGNAGFIIDRSDDNQTTWQQIAHYKDLNALKGQGYSATSTRYAFLDETAPLQGYCYYRLSDVDMNGNRTVHGPIRVDLETVPATTHMDVPYPNPFNPATRISYQLHRDSRVTITVYNLLGRAVNHLVDAHQAAGSYQLLWDGSDQHNQQLAAGTYFIRLETDQYSQTHKVLYLK